MNRNTCLLIVTLSLISIVTSEWAPALPPWDLANETNVVDMTVQKYDELVADYSTGKMHDPSKPWLLFIYKTGCKACESLKEKMIYYANEMKHIYNTGFINKDRDELLKETYGDQLYPRLVVLYENKIMLFPHMYGDQEYFEKFFTEGIKDTAGRELTGRLS